MEDVYFDNALFRVGRAKIKVTKCKQFKHVAKNPVGRPPRLVPFPKVEQPQPLWLQDMHAMADTLLTLEKQVDCSFIKLGCADAQERYELTKQKIRPPHLFPHHPHDNDALFSMSSVTRSRLTILDADDATLPPPTKKVAMSVSAGLEAFDSDQEPQDARAGLTSEEFELELFRQTHTEFGVIPALLPLVAPLALCEQSDERKLNNNLRALLAHACSVLDDSSSFRFCVPCTPCDESGLIAENKTLYTMALEASVTFVRQQKAKASAT